MVIVLIILNNFFLVQTQCKMCSEYAKDKCIDYSMYSLTPPDCLCGCYLLQKALIDDVKIIFTPFIIAYITYSLSEFIFSRIKNK